KSREPQAGSSPALEECSSGQFSVRRDRPAHLSGVLHRPAPFSLLADSLVIQERQLFLPWRLRFLDRTTDQSARLHRHHEPASEPASSLTGFRIRNSP